MGALSDVNETGNARPYQNACFSKIFFSCEPSACNGSSVELGAAIESGFEVLFEAGIDQMPYSLR